MTSFVYQAGKIPRLATRFDKLNGATLFGWKINTCLLHDTGGLGLAPVFAPGIGVLLSLQHEGASTVEIESAIGKGAVSERDLHRILKGVAVRMGIGRARDFQQIGQLDQELLSIGPFGSLGPRPSLNKDRKIGSADHRVS